MFTKEKINDYAHKLLFNLTDEELSDLLDEFDVIDENMNLINEIDGLDKVLPLDFPQENTINTLRSDDDMENISTKDALENSANVFEDVIEVPKVVEKC